MKAVEVSTVYQKPSVAKEILHCTFDVGQRTVSFMFSLQLLTISQ
jgi:hypothetical protein